jgi:hypothetical protein
LKTLAAVPGVHSEKQIINLAVVGRADQLILSGGLVWIGGHFTSLNSTKKRYTSDGLLMAFVLATRGGKDKSGHRLDSGPRLKAHSRRSRANFLEIGKNSAARDKSALSPGPRTPIAIHLSDGSFDILVQQSL